MYRDLEEATAISFWDLLRGGDREALAWLYDSYFDVLYNYGRKLGTDAAILEDHIHDLYVDLWRYHATLSATTSVKFYLYRSLRRRLVRPDRAKLLLQDQQGFDAIEPSQEDVIVEQERHRHRFTRLESMLRQLPSRQYEAIVLRFYDNLEYHEIAILLAVNEQSARNLVQRGITQLKLVAGAVISCLALLVSAFGNTPNF